ncbi:MAG: ATPase, T2SS/T4P/T4SS family [Phycisphaerae bacterium]|nr:ATPase, T2SS/T4P/T4SS family [Phycisphaerae bacterium]
MSKINKEQVEEALAIQRQKRGPLGQILIDLGYITDQDLVLALAAQAGMDILEAERIEVADEIIEKIPAQMATTYKVVPVEYDKASNTLTVAIASPDNFRATDDLKTLMGYNVKAVVAKPEVIDRALAAYYGQSEESIQDVLDEMKGDEVLSEISDRGESIDLATLKDLVESSPVKKLLNLVLLQAIRDKSSDIHFEPFESEFKMRYRIDGVLYEMVPPPRHIAVAIASRIKVMANLDIAERRLPQDGRIELMVNSQPIDLRVSVLPTIFGESVVMRVLDRSQVSLDLDKVGLRADDMAVLRQLIGKPNGIIIVTGPTGSGKTTTLYSALRELNDPAVKIITTEDPVEYDIDGIVQVQINSDIGFTFARALRSILRQDPDILLVGEIRDLETAQIAVQASLTGHLVFSTVHTNDAPTTIARLTDLGLEPFLITATLEAIVAQRLVRKICERCKKEIVPTEEMLMELNLSSEQVKGRTFYYGEGCDACNNTGYRGRQGIFEIMAIDDVLRDMIMRNASTNVLRSEARKRGMRSLRQSGLLAIYDGITTIEEVVRETIVEED